MNEVKPQKNNKMNQSKRIDQKALIQGFSVLFMYQAN